MSTSKSENKYSTMSTQERQAVLVDFNRTDAGYQHNKTLTELFEHQVNRAPDAVALIFEDHSLTFRDLNERANRLARAIHEQYRENTGSELMADTLIALYLDRGFDMIISILAVMKAGAAYLPISPEYPEERSQFMLEDSQAQLLVSQQHYKKLLDDCMSKMKVSVPILMADTTPLEDSLNTGNLIKHSQSTDLAYVIYTSGTTGKPKGVMVEHRSVCNLIESIRNFYLFANGETVGLLASYVFDASVEQIFLALLNSGRIVIFSEEERRAVDLLKRQIDRHKITHICAPASLLNAIAIEEHACLKRIVSAGEETPVSLYLKLKDKLINEYGPTEATVASHHYQCSHADECITKIPMGSAIANTRSYVLAKNGQLASLGAPGELHIGGAGVSRGYLNRPELTAERFIENPFATETDKAKGYTRLYKTGDLVRWLPNGQLEYLGRNDSQVKMRGYRIELGEIENLLSTMAMINHAVVIDKDIGGQKQLAAYVVLASSVQGFDAEALRAQLATRLPDYMLPSSFTVLDRIPVTINGKLDRQALPEPEFLRGEYVAPRTHLERQLCEIWQQVLGVEGIGIENNFFDVGGNSLAAIKLVVALNIEFNSQLSVQDIFDCGTICSLSGRIPKSIGQFKFSNYQITPNRGAAEREPFSLTNVQKAYLYGRMGGFEVGNVPTHLYDELLFESLNVPKLEWALNILIVNQPALRTVFNQDHQHIVASVDPYRIIDHGAVSEESFQKIRQLWSHHKYDVSRFPLFNFEVSHHKNKAVLHVSIDALIMDATSMNLLFRDLAELYNAGDISNVQYQAPALSFRDYMLQYDRIRKSALFDKAKLYWQSKLEDYNFDVRIPMQIDPGEVSEPRFARLRNTIDKETWQKIKRKSRSHHITPTSVMLYAYGLLLSKWSGQSKFCINLTLFNRLPLHSEVNDLWGDYTVLELFNFHREKNIPVHQALGRIHEDLWEDIEHNLFDGIDFQRLIRKELDLPQTKALSPFVLTSFLGQELDYSMAMDGCLGHGYTITQTCQVYLDNKIYDSAQGAIIEWDYVEELFEPPKIQQMHEDYCNLVCDLADMEWHAPMPTLTPPDLDLQIIEKANSTERAMDNETLVSICEKGAEQDGGALAVIDATGQYTYDAIIQSSYCLARRLYQGESLKNQLIAVLSEKGHQQVISTLGVMLSGAAYLPLNVDWPIGRIDEVLVEGQVERVLVSQAQYESLVKYSILVDKYEWLVIENIIIDEKILSDQSNLPTIDVDDVAYVIFTSGSTGKPKGVTIPHRGAVNTILAVNESLNIKNTDSVLALSELSFDLSVYDIFGLLAAGGTVVFPDQNRTKEPGHWYELMSRYQLSIWNTVPQLVRLLVDYANDFNLPITSLRWVMMSGDWIPVNLPSQIKAFNKDIRVMSLGGATEGSIWSIWYEVGQVQESWGSIPYGCAMPSQKMYVLGELGEHCPVGVTGEIHIGGLGVALGYWRNDENTQASFIEHETLGRIYKTGDLGRWCQDGYIAFLGRKDHQVKINGYRIELEEIAAKLAGVSGIDNAIAIVQSNQVVAYLVSENFKPRGLESGAHPELDPAEFKLGQHGLRHNARADYYLDELNLVEADYQLRKSYREFKTRPVSLSKKNLDELLKHAVIEPESSISELTWPLLQQVLKPLSAMPLEDKVLPKYLYPSGGSSYAVQTTVILNQELDEIAAGAYYYHPVEHYLSQTDNVLENIYSGGLLSLQFSLYRPAIEPLYNSDSLRLSYLELGHVLAVLERQLSRIGLRYQLHMVSQDEGDYCHLAYITLYKQSDLSVSSNFLSSSVGIDYWEADDSGFSDGKHNFDLCGKDIFKQLTEFGQLLSTSAGLVAFKGGIEPGELVASAYHAQKLTERLYQEDIGSCMLGVIPYDGVNYCFVVGGIEACVKHHPESNISVPSLESHLTAYLCQYLPKYMQPKHYVTMAQLPLTVNGKVNYNLLPAVELQEDKYVAPRNSTERALVEIWQEILNIGRVGINDNFFSIGLDSILAIRLVGRAKAGNISFSVRDIFMHQSIAALAPIVSVFKREQRYQEFSLLDKKTRETLVSSCDAELVDAYPASQLQLGMLIESSRDKATYHEIGQYRINDVFDEARFKRVVEYCVARHEILRTGFIEDETHGYTAIVARVLQPDIDILEGGDDVAELSRDILAQGFIFDRPGLFRIIVNYIDDNYFNFIFSFHHAIMDGWSLVSLILEIINSYVSDNLGCKGSLPDYGKYVANEQRACSDLTVIAFWRNYIGNYEGPLFPVVKPKLGNCLSVNAMRLQLPKKQSTAMIYLADRLCISVDCIFLAICHSVLCSFQDAEELVMGLVVNNRLEDEGGDNQLGLFINTIPIRLASRGKFVDIENWLKCVAEEKNKIMAYKILPYTHIKGLIQPELEIINCVFNYSHYHILDGQEGLLVDGENLAEKTDIPLSINVTRSEGLFELSFVAHQNRVNPEIQAQIMDYLELSLEQISRNYENLENVSFGLSQPDKVVLMSCGQLNAVKRPNDLGRLFERQVELTPDATAIVYSGQSLSYKQLNEKANYLAGAIRDEYKRRYGRIIPAGTLIGLYLNRSINMIVSILAILKSGAAYVPIATEYPEAHTLFVLRDSKAAIVLADDENKEKLQAALLKEQNKPGILSVDDEISIREDRSENLKIDIDPDSLAYVIYTSGTSGEPKGVMISHHNVQHLVDAQIDIFAADTCSRALQFSSYVFDASVSEIFVSLLSGHQLYLCSDRERQDPDLLCALIHENQVELATLPPVILAQIAEKAKLHSLKILVTAGETPSLSMLKHFSRYCRVINAYGPTESTVCVSANIYREGDAGNNIGSAIHNTRVYVLNKQQEKVPVGAPGELYIGGIGLAKGYLNRPALTAERFIDNPFASKADRDNGFDRLYKTGDLVRLNRDGRIDFLGRNDFQVKVRGYRIELVEVESALCAIPGIEQAVVIDQKHDNRTYLQGYVVIRENKKIDSDQLRSCLLDILPEYMVPTVISEIPEIPMTINGKLDRRVLEKTKIPVACRYVGPDTALEKSLCQIWQHVLGLEKVGVEDDFFRIGGDSITALKLVKKLKPILGEGFHLKQLFELNTISRISDAYKDSIAVMSSDKTILTI